MVVGYDISVGRNDDTRAGSGLLRSLNLTLACAATLVGRSEESEWVAEELLKRIALHAYGLRLRVLHILDVYDCRQSLLGSIGQIDGLS